ncbi:MAG: alkaline phosphatase family protein [Anaerolineales bacterium]|nr:alkaline phosphatase family protein [Anaerolineales bacterium]
MSDLTNQFLTDIENHKIPGLSLGNDLIHPNYGGKSILNIPSTICRAFGIPAIGAPALHEEYLNIIDRLTRGNEIRQVIMILMDGLSLHRLRRWMHDGLLPVWEEWLGEGCLLPLTSIVPTTTSSALTSLWTGRSPAEHGIVGYEMWMKEYGMVINSVIHAPMSYKNDMGSLVKAGFKPEEFIPYPTLGTYLAQYNIQARAFQHFSISRSGLSKMLFKDARVDPINTATDLWLNLLQLIESKPQERMFNWVYWGEIDYFSHHYDPDDDRVYMEFKNFCHAFQESFLKPLKQKSKGNILLILTADHGEIATYNNPNFELRYHPSLIRRLHIMPTGEHRLAFLHVRPGQAKNVRSYIQQTWGDQFCLVSSSQAVKAGLFGEGNHHPQLNDRMGEYILVAQEDAYLWWADKDNYMHGRHGGMSSDEMLVPFFVLGL